jgi:signal transduction histidine kinase
MMDRSVASASIPPAPPPRAARILIVEDDGSTANVLETLLGRVGYEVALASDGAIALDMLKNNPPPDILLLDWMLPEASGLEICRRVRERWDPIMLPVLMVTAKTDAESISAAFAVGASDYITKPFLGAELRARIAAHLRVKHLLDERVRIDEHLMEREKLSSLGLLVSGVAHDLKNPLGGISGYAQLLIEEEEDATKLESLRRIMDEVQRCDRIVGELLSFARRHPSERVEVDVAEVLRDTVELRGRQLRSSGLRVQVNVPADLPPVQGDPHQLQQVFLNILINAEQALRKEGGGVEVSAGIAPPSTRRPGDGQWIALSFFNDGPPIPADVLPRIFQPFFTTKGKEEGTGLGLAICQRVVREHGGDMDVESGKDGTTFHIYLPVEAAVAPAEAAATPPAGSG